MRSHLLILSLTTALGLGSTGCIKKVLVDGQIQSFRQAASAVDTVGDYDVGRAGAESGLAQFEGMHALSPDNLDALYLLTKTWTAYGSVFAEDEMQAAQDAGNDDLAEYNKKRARMAYDRAIFFGLQAIGQTDDGFEKNKGNQAQLETWLKNNFSSKDQVPYLLWTGAAWVARAGLMMGDDEEGPGFVAELYVGVALLERAAAIDPSAEHYQAQLVLAAYHARSGMAETDQAKKLLDDVNEKTGGKLLFVPLYTALRYACAKGDAALYQTELNKVLAAQDPEPDQRLENTIAKRQAKRWLGKKRAKDQCGIDLGGSTSSNTSESTPAPAAAPAPEPAPPAESKPEKQEKPEKPAKPAHPHKPTAMAKPADSSR
jgi:TRAP transporter T-component